MSQILFGDDVRFKNGMVYATRTISASGTDVLTNSSGDDGFDNIIIVTTDGPVTIKLPTTAGNGMEEGRMYYIINGAGGNITVDGAGNNVNGSAT